MTTVAVRVICITFDFQQPVAVGTLGLLYEEVHNRQETEKSHAFHSRSAENYVLVPTYFRGNSAFQCSIPCQHVHSF